jgi:hypothetical protein
MRWLNWDPKSRIAIWSWVFLNVFILEGGEGKNFQSAADSLYILSLAFSSCSRTTVQDSWRSSRAVFLPKRACASN